MTVQRGVFWRNALGALLAVAWAVGAHLASAGVGPVDLRVAVGVVPLLVALALVVWNLPARTFLAWWVFAAALAAAVSGWAWLRVHLTWLFCLQHLGIHLALAVWFGRSLAAGRQPVITAMAGLIAGHALSPRHARYTRGVTWLWTLFFLGNAAVSLLLFAWAPIEIWSMHANLLTGPLVAGVFLVEMLVRRRMLPPEERPSLQQVMRSYHASRQKSALAPSSKP